MTIGLDWPGLAWRQSVPASLTPNGQWPKKLNALRFLENKLDTLIYGLTVGYKMPAKVSGNEL